MRSKRRPFAKLIEGNHICTSREANLNTNIPSCHNIINAESRADYFDFLRRLFLSSKIVTWFLIISTQIHDIHHVS